MKIISKYKDYYDYLQGIYGVDEKLVLDRRKAEHTKYHSEGKHTFVIGDLMVDSFYLNDKFYCGESDMIKLGGTRNKNERQPNIVSYNIPFIDSFGRKVTSNVCVTPYGKGRPDNKFDEYAIYEIVFRNPYSQSEASPYPILENYGIQRVLKPHDIWIELSAWLGKQATKREPEVPVGDDKVRILSAGFDLKTSFRNVK